MSSCRVNSTSRCAISALRIIPTVLCSHSLTSSNGLPGSSAATRLQEKLSKLDALLAQSTHNPEHVAVLANLLALPADDHYRLQDLTPQKRKEKTFAALLAQLDGLAARQPVLIIFEDVHWIDPTSLELLAATVEHVPQLRALLLITARPEFTPPWPSYPAPHDNLAQHASADATAQRWSCG